MLFKVPVRYKIRGTISGSQKTGNHILTELMEIDIPFVDEDDAPVAVEWNGRVPDNYLPSHVEEALGPVPAGGRCHTRVWKRQHYRPVLAADEANGGRRELEIVTDLTFSATSGTNAAGRDSFHPPLLNRGRSRAVVVDGHALFERVEWSDRAAKQRASRIQAEEMAFIGDRLYRRCIEPEIVSFPTPTYPAAAHSVPKVAVRGNPGGATTTSTEVVLLAVMTDPAAKAALPERGTGIEAKKKSYSLAEVKRAVEASTRANSKYRVGNPAAEAAIGFNSMLDVRVNAEVMRDRAYVEVTETMRLLGDFLESVGRERARDLPTRVLALYSEIREAAETLRGDEGLDRLDKAVHAFVTEVGDGHPCAYYSTLLKSALDRLSSRTIDVSL